MQQRLTENQQGEIMAEEQPAQEITEGFVPYATLTLVEGKTARFSVNEKSGELQACIPWDNATPDEIRRVTEHGLILRDLLDEHKPLHETNHSASRGHLAHHLSCIVHERCTNVPHDIGIVLVRELVELYPDVFGVN